MLRARALAELGLLSVALLAAGCGARTELAKPPPGYKVLFPSSSPGDPPGQVTLSLWHSRTGAVSTVGTFDLDLATFTFDGRFIAIERRTQPPPTELPDEVDVIEPDGSLVWSQAEPQLTAGQQSWWWLGALRPDGQRLLGTDGTAFEQLALAVVDRGGVPVPILDLGPPNWDAFIWASYAPDGQTLVAIVNDSPDGTSSTATNKLELLRDGGAAESVLVGPVLDDVAVLFSPSFDFTGSAVAYVKCSVGPQCEVDVVDVASRASRTVYSPASEVADPHFTPDGKGIVIRDWDYPSRVETVRRLDLATGTTSILWQGRCLFAPEAVGVAVDE